MSSSEEIVRQFQGQIPGMATGQNAVAKVYVDDELAIRDGDILAVAGSAAAAQNAIDQHEVAPVAHPATAITYAGVVDAGTVEEAIDKSSERVEYFIANSGNSVAEIVNARAGEPQLNDRLNKTDAKLADIATFNHPILNASPDTLEIIWVGDSTTDKNVSYQTDNSPTIVLHEEFNFKFLKKGRPLSGALSTVFARSGASTLEFLTNTVTGASFAGIDDVIDYCNTQARNNVVVVYSLGHNDGITMANWESTILPRHKLLINRIMKETNAFVILRMPNAWASAQGGADIDTATDKSLSLKNLYLKLGEDYKNKALMLDIQDILGWTGGSWTQTAWAATSPYSAGTFVQKDGSVYRCITAGTSGSVGPSGTGASIADGTVAWAYESYLNPYMGDWTHPNQLGYKAIANVAGEAIAKMIAPIIPQDVAQVNKGFDLNSAKIAEIDTNYQDFGLVYDGTILQAIGSNNVIIDMDYSRSKTTIQYGDLLVLGGNNTVTAQYVQADTLLSVGAVTRAPSTAYSLYQFALVAFDSGTWLCICRQAGTSNGNATLGAMFDGKRDTWIWDGSAAWQCLKRAEQPTSLFFNTNKADMSAFTFGDRARIYRRQSQSRFLKQHHTGTVEYDKYVKVAEMEINLIYKTGTASFIVSSIGSTNINLAVVEVAYSQSAVLPSDPAVTIRVHPLQLSAADEIVASRFIAVPIVLSATLTRIALFYRNAGYPNRQFGFTLLSTAQNDPGVPGNSDSNAPLFFLSPEMATSATTLPTTAAGGTNKTGAYTNALYIGASDDGSLKKITVNAANTITATSV